MRHPVQVVAGEATAYIWLGGNGFDDATILILAKLSPEIHLHRNPGSHQHYVCPAGAFSSLLRALGLKPRLCRTRTRSERLELPQYGVMP